MLHFNNANFILFCHQCQNFSSLVLSWEVKRKNLTDCIRPSRLFFFLFRLLICCLFQHSLQPSGRQAFMLKAKWHQVQNCWCNANMQALAKPSKEQIRFQEQTVEKFLILYSVQCPAVSFQHLSQVLISRGIVGGVMESPCISLLSLVPVCMCVHVYMYLCAYMCTFWVCRGLCARTGLHQEYLILKEMWRRPYVGLREREAVNTLILH